MKCSVKQRGKFFIVIDPFHHKSYTLNNRLGAESLAVTLNNLHNENEQLKQALKNHYINEICENCKFGHYDVDWYGEGEFECLKGHEGWKCDGKTECEDFELDLERFLK